jgi:hypothetical protein
VRREVGLAGVELAPFAGAHDLAGVGDRGGPVEDLAERVAHKGARRCVVAAHARVDVPKELAPLRDGYASLQDAGRGALVQLAVDESERLGHPGDASSLGSVRGDLPSIHPGDVLVAPIPLIGGWLRILARGALCCAALAGRGATRVVVVSCMCFRCVS